jgi:DNA-binding response OmpR family regulator
MPHVLVCDDDKLFAALMRRALQQHGHEVTIAEDAKSAREALTTGVFDVFVCDIVLPDENGLHVLRDARQAHPAMALLAASGGKSEGRSVHIDVLHLAETLGADAVVKKPFELSSFVATVEGALAKRHRAQRAG